MGGAVGFGFACRERRKAKKKAGETACPTPNVMTVVSIVILCSAVSARTPKKAADLWALKPVVRPQVPTSAEYKSKGLRPAGPADKRTLLRRVYLDLVGIPPTLPTRMKRQ